MQYTCEQERVFKANRISLKHCSIALFVVMGFVETLKGVDATVKLAGNLNKLINPMAQPPTNQNPAPAPNQFVHNNFQPPAGNFHQLGNLNHYNPNSNHVAAAATQPPKQEDNSLAIGLGIGIPAVLIVLALIAGFIYYRRRQQKRGNSGPRQKASEENVERNVVTPIQKTSQENVGNNAVPVQKTSQENLGGNNVVPKQKTSQENLANNAAPMQKTSQEKLEGNAIPAKSPM